MNYNHFRTELVVNNLSTSVSYQHPVVLMGSCFVEHIGKRLEMAGFDTCLNSHGILYNPVSLQKALEDIIALKRYSPNELFAFDDKYISWRHHGQFTGRDADAVCDQINPTIENAHNALKSASHLFLTLGTSWVFEKDGEVVGNCHKVPASAFNRRLLSQEEVNATLFSIHQQLKNFNPGLNLVMTVSPVRHLKDGAVDNQRSKARLLLGCELLEQSGAGYFPAYEIMMDDLRDYRFYNEDMIHPNQTAQDYVWEKFKKAAIEPALHPQMDAISKFRSSLNHRVMSPDPIDANEFYDGRKLALEKLVAQYPGYDFGNEKGLLESCYKCV